MWLAGSFVKCFKVAPTKLAFCGRRLATKPTFAA